MTKINAHMVVDTDGKTVSEKIGISSKKLLEFAVWVTDFEEYIPNKNEDRALWDWSLAIQNAINYAQESGGGSVFFPTGDYLIKSGVKVTSNYITLVGYCARILYDNNVGVALDYDAGNVNIRRVGLVGIQVVKLDTNDSWNQNCTGIRANGMVWSSFVDFEIVGFKYGLVLTSSIVTAGTAYNEIRIRRLYDNQINLLLTITNDGWTNENNFYGGSLNIASARVDKTGAINLKIDHQPINSNMLNNNKFFGLCFEGGGKAILCEGWYNFFNHCRYEGSVDIEFTANAQNNVVFYGRGLIRSNIIDNGLRNHIFSREGQKIGASTFTDQEGVFDAYNIAGDAYLAYVARNPATKAITTSINGKGDINTTGELKASKFVFQGGSGSRGIAYGVGSPEGVVTATPGNIYINGNGGAGQTLWVKETGFGNTGWTPK